MPTRFAVLVALAAGLLAVLVAAVPAAAQTQGESIGGAIERRSVYIFFAASSLDAVRSFFKVLVMMVTLRSWLSMMKTCFIPL